MDSLIALAVAVLVVVLLIKSANKGSTRGEIQDNRETYAFGIKNDVLICPHCQIRGFIQTKQVKRKKGISGAKATGALLTGGLSILATGLSKKDTCTQVHCGRCGMTWDV